MFVVFVSFKYLDLPWDPLTGACFSNYIEIGPSTHHRVVCGEQAEPYTSPADVRLFAMKFFAGSTPKGHGFIVSYSIGKDLILVRFWPHHRVQFSSVWYLCMLGKGHVCAPLCLFL